MTDHIDEILEEVKRTFRPVEAQDIPGVWPDPHAKFWSDECLRAVCEAGMRWQRENSLIGEVLEAKGRVARRGLAQEVLEDLGVAFPIPHNNPRMTQIETKLREIAEEEA